MAVWMAFYSLRAFIFAKKYASRGPDKIEFPEEEGGETTAHGLLGKGWCADRLQNEVELSEDAKELRCREYPGGTESTASVRRSAVRFTEAVDAPPLPSYAVQLDPPGEPLRARRRRKRSWCSSLREAEQIEAAVPVQLLCSCR